MPHWGRVVSRGRYEFFFFLRGNFACSAFFADGAAGRCYSCEGKCVFRICRRLEVERAVFDGDCPKMETRY